MPSKRWSDESWIELARTLSSWGLNIVCTGSAEDAEPARRISSALESPAIVLAGELSLRETISVVEDCRLFVGPDTGMTHVAAAAGVPTVAIFGPTNPRRYGPIGPFVEICAAPGSHSVADYDLRRSHAIPQDARTDLVSVGMVFGACERVIEARAAAMDVPGSFNAKYDWLLEHLPFLDTQNFVFCGNKAVIHTDYLIDDSPRQLHAFKGTGILYTMPYNVHVEDFVTVSSWKEIGEYFKKGDF